MEKQQNRQLHIIWDCITSPIEIPEETRKRLIDLLGELLSVYWQGRTGNIEKQERNDEHDQQNKN